jgi:hypothetical protein
MEDSAFTFGAVAVAVAATAIVTTMINNRGAAPPVADIDFEDASVC